MTSTICTWFFNRSIILSLYSFFSTLHVISCIITSITGASCIACMSNGRKYMPGEEVNVSCIMVGNCCNDGVKYLTCMIHVATVAVGMECAQLCVSLWASIFRVNNVKWFVLVEHCIVAAWQWYWVLSLLMCPHHSIPVLACRVCVTAEHSNAHQAIDGMSRHTDQLKEGCCQCQHQHWYYHCAACLFGFCCLLPLDFLLLVADFRLLSPAWCWAISVSSCLFRLHRPIVSHRCRCWALD